MGKFGVVGGRAYFGLGHKAVTKAQKTKRRQKTKQKALREWNKHYAKMQSLKQLTRKKAITPATALGKSVTVAAQHGEQSQVRPEQSRLVVRKSIDDEAVFGVLRKVGLAYTVLIGVGITAGLLLVMFLLG